MSTRSWDLEARISDKTPRSNVLRTMAVAVPQEKNSLKMVSVVRGNVKLKVGIRR